MKKQPKRLTSDQYLSPSAPFRIYYQKVEDRYDLHWHEFYELCFIVRGSGTNVMNGEPHGLVPGSLFLLTPADFHEIFPDSGGTIELFNVVFTGGYIDESVHELLFRGLAELAVTLPEQDAARMEAEFRLIWNESAEPRTGSAIVSRGALERILVELVRQCGDRGKRVHSGAHPSVHKALVYMHHYFRGPLTLEDAARQAGLNPNYFSECFRRLTGSPFQSYLQSLRLTFAKSLLAASDLPVTEICYASGFQTLTHFERTFKRKFGHPPGYYRRKATR